VPKIIINKDDNEEFYNLFEEFNNIMDRWNTLNSQLHEFRIPRLWLFGVKNELKKISKDLKELQDDFLVWQEKATKFFIEPNFKIPSESDGDLTFIHMTNVLQYFLSKLNSSMVLIADNNNKAYSDYEDQINFIIAILSFIISIFGLSITIVPFII